MRITALLAAGALAAGTLASVPAEAQRYGYRDHGYGAGVRGYRHRFDGPRRGYGVRAYGYGYRDRGYRPRTVCRLTRGYYGPVRRCFRIR